MNQNSNTWYAFKNLANEEVELMIYDYIGYFGISAKQLVTQINALKAKKITVAINSGGGEVFDGFAIFEALKRHEATISVRVDGYAASIASIVAMAGDEITMSETAYMMIHNPWSIAVGDANEMTKSAEILEKLTVTVAQTYAARCGQSESTVRQMMDEETWMNADEAVEAGFANAKLSDQPAEQTTPQNRYVAYVRNLDRVPAALRARMEIKPVSAFHTGQVPTACAVGVEAATEVKETPMNAEAFRKYAADNSDSAEVKELFARGQKAGSASGQAQAKSDLQAMTEAFPDDPAYVLKCYAKGRTVDEARELKAEIDTATATANAAMTAAKAEAEQAKAKLGEQGAINLRASATADIDADDTKAVAAAEWDANPEVRKGFRNKDNYVFARAAELDGSHKSFSREPMKV